MMQKLNIIAAGLILGAVILIAEVSAFEFEGPRLIKLVESNGTEHSVGAITFMNSAGKATYKIEWMDEHFTEHFLSMRPFKCFEGSSKYWCRVPYPYENRRHISATDLTDLEYDLLFIWKGASEYGINLWNGVYYRLVVDGDRLLGKLNEMDMKKLGVPPEAANMRPIRDVDLEEGDAASHWLPTLIIE